MLDGSKRRLVQQVGDRSIIKRFDKTPFPIKTTDVICPHFLELKWAYGCPHDCSWCYLKGTLRLLPTKTKPVFKNRKKIESHVNTFFRATKNSYPQEIINTGELADSLMSENTTTPFSKFIIPLFETNPKHRVLFLTKSVNVKNLLDTAPSKRAVISFTVNANPVAKKWEVGAPLVRDRIMAAKAVHEVGYETRIRIDPMVPIEGWKKYYFELIDEIFSNFVPERITLGSLRGLQSTINEAKDKSWVRFLSEKSNWGKKIPFDLRYPMYLALMNRMKEKFNYSNIALCKETFIMWDKLKMNWKKCRCNCAW